MARSTVAVTMGDPAGIGPEIVASALAAELHRAVVVGDLNRLEQALTVSRFGGRAHLRSIVSASEARFEPGAINVIDLRNVPRDLPWGELSSAAGAAAYAYLEKATRMALDGQVDAICTAPINKEAWREAGVPHPGHTEALAALTETDRYAMMLVNQKLRVVHLSTHTSLAQAIAKATTNRCLDCIELAAEFLTQRAGVVRPRVAVAGLNPHAGENGLLGNEDRDRLLPAVAKAHELGIDASGPWPADTVYVRAAAGEFDAVVAPYHDQGHIPIKMIGLDTGVNVTIGLPIIRTSVDHGTAFDIAGSGQARHANLLAALRLAEELAGG